MKKQLFIFVFVLLLLPFIQACDDSTNNQNGGTGGNTDGAIMSVDKTEFDLGTVDNDGSKRSVEFTVTNNTEAAILFYYELAIEGEALQRSSSCQSIYGRSDIPDEETGDIGLGYPNSLPAKTSCTIKIEVTPIFNLGVENRRLYVFAGQDTRDLKLRIPIKWVLNK